LLVLAGCYAFGWIALFADEYRQLGKHIAGGAGFVANFVLWSESGYFDNSAATKPLLHLWSLGIEEQFYIVWPLLLWFAWKRAFNLVTIIALVAAVSFYLNVAGQRNNPAATFYSPQTRFWELLAGSLLAWLIIYRGSAFLELRTRVDRWFAINVCGTPFAARTAISVPSLGW
jgi:peptidoglycan/LPS O-acetylase OafA/YrhL